VPFRVHRARDPAVPGDPPYALKPARGRPRHERQTAGGSEVAVRLCLSI